MVKYNLEERSEKFARDCRNYIKKLSSTLANIEDGKQLIKSSGSQAANYIEANEATSKKECKFRIRVSKKETKESRLWLRLIEPAKKQEKEKQRLIDEANQLMRIYGSIVEKMSQ